MYRIDIKLVLLYGKVNLSVLIWFFLGRDLTIRTVSTKTVQAVYFFCFKSRQIYLQLKILKENMSNTLFLRIEEDDDELANSKTNERIQ